MDNFTLSRNEKLNVTKDYSRMKRVWHTMDNFTLSLNETEKKMN